MKCLKCRQGELKPIKKDGKSYARCDKCGALFSADDLRNYATQKTQSSQPQAPEKKKSGRLKTGMIIVGLFLAIFIAVGVIANLSGDNHSSNEKKVADKTGSEKSESKINGEKDNNTKNFTFDFSDTNMSFGEQNIDGLKILHGELLSVIYNNGIVVVKAKIAPSLTNKMTIDQNYFNVADLVKKHGFNTCEELQYWAVADMSSGDESKCISFTLDKTAIDGLYNENIVENQLGDYTTDLWVLPSLQNQ